MSIMFAVDLWRGFCITLLLFANFSLAILAPTNAFHAEQSLAGYRVIPSILLSVVSTVSLFYIIPIFILDTMKKSTFIPPFWLEMSFLGIFSILQFAGGGAAHVINPQSLFQDADPMNLSNLNLANNVMIAFAFGSATIMLSLLLTEAVIVIRQYEPGVWAHHVGWCVEREDMFEDRYLRKIPPPQSRKFDFESAPPPPPKSNFKGKGKGVGVRGLIISPPLRVMSSRATYIYPSPNSSQNLSRFTTPSTIVADQGHGRKASNSRLLTPSPSVASFYTQNTQTTVTRGDSPVLGNRMMSSASILTDDEVIRIGDGERGGIKIGGFYVRPKEQPTARI